MNGSDSGPITPEQRTQVQEAEDRFWAALRVAHDANKDIRNGAKDLAEADRLHLAAILEDPDVIEARRALDELRDLSWRELAEFLRHFGA